MAETITVRMSRSDGQTPWGFQVHGGTDYNQPIGIGAVTHGSLADRAGLKSGDQVQTLCGRQASAMSHRHAQETVIQAGNTVDLIVQRMGGGGGSSSGKLWRPTVTSSVNDSVSGSTKFQHSVHSTSNNNIQVDTHNHSPQIKVSLEHTPQHNQAIAGFNRPAQPFNQPQVVHQQYNSPGALYSQSGKVDEYLRQTGGCFGTDPSLFKDQQAKSGLNTHTLLAVQEEDRQRAASPLPRARSPRMVINSEPFAAGRPETLHATEEQSGSFKRLTHALHAEDSKPPIRNKRPDPMLRKLQKKNGDSIHDAIKKLEHLQTCQFTREDHSGAELCGAPQQPGGGPLCDHCGRAIIGVFCNAGGKTLHGECFKCNTCGSSLKNVGFFNMGGKLYCEIHASQRTQNLFGARAPQPPETFYPSAVVPSGILRSSSPPKAATKLTSFSYQPEILKPGPVSPRPSTKGAISPSQRGVPTHQSMYTSPSTEFNQMAHNQQHQNAYSSSTSYSTNMRSNNVYSNSEPHIVPSRVSYNWPPDRAEHPVVPYWSSTTVNDPSLSPRSPVSTLWPILQLPPGPPPLPAPKNQSDAYQVRVEQMKRQSHGVPVSVLTPDGAQLPPAPVSPSSKQTLLLPSQFPAKSPVILPADLPAPIPSANEVAALLAEHSRTVIKTLPVISVSTTDANTPSALNDRAAFGNSDAGPLSLSTIAEGSSYEDLSVTNRSHEHLQLDQQSQQKAEVPSELQELDAVLDMPAALPKPMALIDRPDPEEVLARLHRQEELMEDDTGHQPPMPIESIYDEPELAEFAADLSSNAMTNAKYSVDLEDTVKMFESLADEFAQQAKELDAQYERELIDRQNEPPVEVYPTNEHLVQAEYILAKHDVVRKGENKENNSPFEKDRSEQVQEAVHSGAYSAPAPTAPMMAPAPMAPPMTMAPPPPSAPPPALSGRSGGGQAPTAPVRGRGILKQLGEMPRTPYCEDCHREIRGPFVLALNKTWCPEHFCCNNQQCGRKLLDVGFVEEQDKKYCEYCFEQYFAPKCAKCSRAIPGDCLNALDKQWHPECFTCAHCNQAFGNSSFFLEDGKPYCEQDWNQLYTTKCVSCKFPIEAGDRWVEALGAAYHSDCFVCSHCHTNLEGQSFYAKGGRPYCKAHA